MKQTNYPFRKLEVPQIAVKHIKITFMKAVTRALQLAVDCLGVSRVTNN